MQQSSIRAALVRLGIVIAALFFTAPSQAAPLVLEAGASGGGLSLAGHLEMLHDPSGQLTQAQVASDEYAGQFTPLPGALNGGFSRTSAWWVRFAVSVRDDDVERWWLRLNVPYVDYVDVWLPARAEDGSVTLQHRALGGLRPISARDMPWNMTALHLKDLLQGEPQWIWIRLSGHRTVSLAGQIYPLDAMGADFQNSAVRVAAVIGMMMMMTVVSLMLGVSLPDRQFLWYAAYLGSSTLLFVCSESMLSALVLPEQPQLSVRIHNLAMCLSLFTSVVFAHSLLDLPQRFPRVGAAFRILAAASVVSCIAAAAGYYGAIAPLVNFTRLLLASVIVVLCVLLVRQRAPSAWPNLIGFGVYATAGIVHFAKNLDWLPFNRFTQYSYLLGVIVHMLAIFLSLGLRVRARERQALTDSQMAGARLEARVADRTRELQAEIERRQQAQAQLQKAMHEQRNFLSMVTHEFRTPLSIIGASAEMIGDERLPRSAQDTLREAAKISRAKQRMIGLVDTLLADEWLEYSSIQLTVGDLDLADLLEEKCEEHADSSGRSIRLDLPQDSLAIRADERLLHIVFDNLIENAVKYSPADTAIDVRVWRDGDRAFVTVRDHGAGFAPEDLEPAFERFFRSSKVLQKPGIGLGLFMVRRIAELHGGEAFAANADNGGAILTVRLPVAGPRR